MCGARFARSMKTMQLWSTDTNTHTDHIEVTYICDGDIAPYYFAQAFYLLLLITCIIAVFLKTKKLSFGDAKKVNIFVFILVLVSISGLAVCKVVSDRSLYLPA